MSVAVDDARSICAEPCIIGEDRPDTARRSSCDRLHPKRRESDSFVIRYQKLGSFSRQIEQSRLLERHREGNGLSTLDGHLNEEVAWTEQHLVEIDSRTVGSHWADFCLTVISQRCEPHDFWHARSSENGLPEGQRTNCDDNRTEHH